MKSKREKPIEDKVILRVLKGRKRPLDRLAIAEKLGISYHRLIRRMHSLVKANLVTERDGGFLMVA